MARSKTPKSSQKPSTPSSEVLASKSNGIDIDGKGNRGPDESISKIAFLKNNWNQFTKAERDAILNKGEATIEYVYLRRYQIYMDEKKGIIRNDKDDPKFRFNLEKKVEDWRHAEVEFYVMFDNKGRFLGYNIGDHAEVNSVFFKGTLVGGHTMHNHPTKEDRPLGLSFSAPDLTSIRGEGTRNFEVTTAEGRYSMNTNGRQISEKSINEWKTSWEAHKAALYSARDPSGRPIPEHTLWRIRAIDHHQSMQALAKANGWDYKFTPLPKYKDLMDIKSLSKPLPKIK